MQKIIIEAQCFGSVKSCKVYVFKLIDDSNADE